jgi:hypothetical protein
VAYPLRRLVWWLQGKVIWPLADALRGVRSDPALLDATRQEAPGARAFEPSGRPPVAVLICLGAAIACSGAVLLIFQSHFTFLTDDWEFLLYRRGFSAAVFLDPHYDHIAIAQVAIYKALLAVFGMRSALPVQIVSTLLFLLSVLLLFVYLRRRAGDWLALLGSVLILFLGAASTDLLWPFMFTFSGAIAAGIGALLALDRNDRKGDLGACALLVLSISFSELGISFAMGAFVIVALGRAPRRSRLYVALLPLALYGLWYLGWGRTVSHPAIFHNLVHSPRFVVDSISQNLASLFGLATPLSGNGANLVGMNSGRVLLVIAIGLAIWRLARMGWPSRWLWAVLAAGAVWWFLTALNAIAFLRAPTTDRYQYPGAIFLLLIAAELLRGVRLDRRVLAAATAVTVAAAISGYILLHDRYLIRKETSDGLRAQLAAVEIGRGHERGDLTLGFASFFRAPASSYFSAVDALGSPAFSESELAASDEANRVAADQMLATAEGIKLGPIASGADQGSRAAGRCRTVTARSGSQPLALGPGSYTLKARKLSGATVKSGAPVQAARFADQPSVNLGALEPRAAAALSIPPDKSNRGWRLYLPPASAVSVCRLPG